ncbi:MAG: hypothetical protein AC479_02130 [miscellaneous Crenarchaeota group-6 archaeon AD8-1]|nr:MAG: hypothetical protein AC479_02130 [miscellaneous Crenarchaeota group-6 archaeon AD8-1]
MPLTPLHYPIAYLVNKVNRNLSLPGLIVGSMIPDFEIPVILFINGFDGPNRLVLHSLLGSATLGTALAILVTIKFYPILVSSLFRVDKEKVENKCNLSLALVFSVLIGNIFHVLLDFTNHQYSPILWPFLEADKTPSPIFMFLGEQFGYLWIQVIMGFLLLVLILVEKKDLVEKLLIG